MIKLIDCVKLQFHLVAELAVCHNSLSALCLWLVRLRNLCNTSPFSFYFMQMLWSLDLAVITLNALMPLAWCRKAGASGFDAISIMSF